MKACPKKLPTPFRRASENEFNRSYPRSPHSREFLGEFLFPRQNFGHCEIVLSQKPPKSASREQVPGIRDWAKRLSQGANESDLVLSSSVSYPTKHRSIFVSVRIYTERFRMSVHCPGISKSIKRRVSNLPHAPFGSSMANPTP